MIPEIQIRLLPLLIQDKKAAITQARKIFHLLLDGIELVDGCFVFLPNFSFPPLVQKHHKIFPAYFPQRRILADKCHLILNKVKDMLRPFMLVYFWERLGDRLHKVGSVDWPPRYRSPAE